MSHQKPVWLRPVWALLLCALLATEYSPVSAQLKSQYSPDQNWIQIDIPENFPQTTNAQDEIERFIYKRGPLDPAKDIKFKPEFLDQIKDQDTTFHLQFEFWRSNTDCIKYLGVSPESITGVDDKVKAWKTIERYYKNEKNITDFKIRLFADKDGGHCEKLMTAIKNMKLTYSSYQQDDQQGDDSQVKDSGLFQTITTPTEPQVKKEDLKEWNTYLHSCKTTPCTLTFPGTAVEGTNELHLSFWHTSPTTVITVEGFDAIKPTTNGKLHELIIKKANVEKESKLPEKITIKIVANDDTYLAVKSNEQIPADTPNMISFDPTKTGDIVHQPEFKLLPNAHKTATVFLNKEATIATTANPCYKLSYYQKEAATIKQFKVTLVAHETKTISSQYKLFELAPSKVNEVENVHFCLRELVRDTKVLEKSVQFLLETSSNIQADEKHPKWTVVALTPEADKAPTASLRFFSSRITDFKHQWTTMLPGVIPQTDSHIIKAHQQSIELHSVWIKKSDKLHETPVEVELSITNQSLLASSKIEAKMCDEIMDCLRSVTINKVAGQSSPTKSSYSITFESHPSKVGTHLKLVLNVNLGSKVAAETQIEVAIVNFGDPCHNKEAKCGKNADCTADNDDVATNKIEANDWTHACHPIQYCKTGADAETQCPAAKTKGCRNNFNNDNFECVCDVAKAFSIWDGTKKDCEAVQVEFTKNDVDNNKPAIWTFPLSKINSHIYEVCYKFTLPTKPATSETVTFALKLEQAVGTGKTEIVTLVPGVNIELNQHSQTEVVDLCLSQLVDYVTEGSTLIAEITSPTVLAKEQSHFYGKDKSKEQVAKLNSDAHSFKLALDLPKGIVKINSGKEIVFAQNKDQLPENIETVLYSEWIVNDKSYTEEQIKKNVFQLTYPLATDASLVNHVIEICRPRTAAGYDCVEYNNNNNKLADTLAKLGADKFQVAITVTATKTADNAEKLAAAKLTAEVSLWDVCKMNEGKCMHNSVCKPTGDEHKFKCVKDNSVEVCPDGFLGQLCDIDEKKSCDETNAKQCGEHKCLPLANGKFTCDCPSGYKYDETNKKCIRMMVKENVATCEPDQPDSCFLTELMAEPFAYLPKYFPKIGDSQSKNLYYSVQSGSKLTISVEDPEKWFAKPGNDHCIRFRYFVAPKAKLSLQFNDQIELLNIEGTETESTEIDFTKKGVELSETRVCVKAFLAEEKYRELTQYHLSFVAQTPGKDDAVAVEILPYDSTHVLESRSDLKLPEKPLKYLSEKTADLLPAKTENAPTALSYQWPKMFPPERWSEISAEGAFTFSKAQSNNIETAYLESAWLSRPVGPSFLPVYLTFTVEVDYPNDNQFTMNVYLIDSDRRRIGTIGSVTEKDIPDPPERPTFKKAQFALPVLSNIESNKNYTVQFHIRYHDKKPKTAPTDPLASQTPLFKISQISFGDPCTEVKTELVSGVSKRSYHPLQCWGVVKENNKNTHKQTNDVKCNRVELTNGGMDFQCECDTKAGLSGKDCKKLDHCIFEGSFEVANPEPIRPKKSVINTSGNTYCANGDKKVAQCKPGRYEEYKFLCQCPQKEPHYFDYFSQECKPVSKCVLDPCQSIETQQCEEKIDGQTRRAECNTCKAGYELKVVPNPQNDKENVTMCAPQAEFKCDKKEVCQSDDPNMECIADETGAGLCRCPKGFIRSGGKCESRYCDFPGFHTCTQNCENINTAPFYKCSCDRTYYDEVKSGDEKNPTVECKLKDTAPEKCKSCTGKYTVCKSGECACLNNFVFDEKKENCIPPSEYKPIACPENKYKIDVNNEVVCDCGNTTLGFFEADKGACGVAKTVCDAGESGRNFCTSKHAGCLLTNPKNINDFSCLCQLGKLFPDGKRTKKHSELIGRDMSATCIDVCELPYKKSQCSAIGATCNPWKLWEQIHIFAAPSIQNINPESYCDCVQGTFYDKQQAACVQEPEALSLGLTVRWSHELQGQLDRKILYSIKIKDTDGEDLKEFDIDNIDPTGVANHIVKARQLNYQAEETIRKQLTEEQRKSVLQNEVEKLFSNFGLIGKSVTNEGELIEHEVQIASIHEEKVQNKPSNYKLQLAVKLSSEIKSRRVDQPSSSFYDGEVVEQDTATTTTVAPTTKAAASHPTTLPYDLSEFNLIMTACQQLDQPENCIIPYMSLVLGWQDKVTPVLHKPCDYKTPCEGMSDCVPLNGSQFECKCNTDFFTPESRYTFKSTDPMIVFNNERCKSRTLCDKCLAASSNNECTEQDPVQHTATNTWTKGYECRCKKGYQEHAPEGKTEKTCTDVCVIADCKPGNTRTCHAGFHDAACECNSGYYGPKCEHSVAGNTGWIVAVVVLAVLAVVAIGAAIFLFMRSSNKPQQHHNHSSSPSSPVVTTNGNNRQANIRRISAAKSNLQPLKDPTEPNTIHHTESSTSQPQSTIVVSSNKSYEVTQVEAVNQQQSAGPLEPGQTKLRLDLINEESASQHSIPLSQKSAKSTDESTEGIKYSSNTARSSFISADVSSLAFSRQTSENSLAFHEPFTPYSSSPKTLYSRKSVATIGPTIEEKNELLYSQIKDELTMSQQSPQFSHSSSSSSESSSIPPRDVPPEVVLESGPLEPGNTTLVTSEESSESSQSSTEPLEPGNQTLTAQNEPSSSEEPANSSNLIVDSQEMNQAKFQHVRDRIAAVLRFNSFRSYELASQQSKLPHTGPPDHE